MKTIIILTHVLEEYKSFSGNLPEQIVDDGYAYIEIKNTERAFFILRTNTAPITGNSVVEVINKIDTPKCILFHGINLRLDGQFNVTSANNNDNRNQYQKLIDANFRGDINTDEKQKVFDEVWDWFSNHEGMKQFNALKEFFTNIKLSDIGNDTKLAELQNKLNKLGLTKLK
jgi:hypothetical protein